MEASVPSSSRRRALRPGRLDGLKIRVIDDPMVIGADLDRAMKTLAKLMVRSHEAHDDHEAIVGELGSSSSLTRAAVPRTDHTDEAA